MSALVWLAEALADMKGTDARDLSLHTGLPTPADANPPSLRVLLVESPCDVIPITLLFLNLRYRETGRKSMFGFGPGPELMVPAWPQSPISPQLLRASSSEPISILS
ncbi:unnamed protein product [Lota lota]